jgi:hypothetical protein
MKTLTSRDSNLVRKLAMDSFGQIIDLSNHEKEKLRKALKESQNISLSECVVAANENEIEADTRQLLKFRQELLRERMREIMQSEENL